MSDTLALYRDLTGDSTYDEVLSRQQSYYDYIINGNTARLTQDFIKIRDLLLGHMEVLTSEVRFTDRIFKFKHNYIDKVFSNTIATSTSFDVLYYSISGIRPYKTFLFVFLEQNRTLTIHRSSGRSQLFSKALH